jgi:hypothetical protein
MKWSHYPCRNGIISPPNRLHSNPHSGQGKALVGTISVGTVGIKIDEDNKWLTLIQNASVKNAKSYIVSPHLNLPL